LSSEVLDLEGVAAFAEDVLELLTLEEIAW
jgi:hypothetical protein